MGHASSWKDPNTNITYNRGDKITITGTVYYSADGTSGTHGYYSNYTCYFYSYFTATWDVKVPICIGMSAGTAWAYVYPSSIKSGGTREKYTVSYNANGGSGAPGSQTKYYGTTLKLSGTKPTRTGYTFKGWATSATGSVVYAAGGSYTANKGATLYAVWQINTYTVSYNANGGTGGPHDQTKTYGVNLTLSGTKPTRTGYTFNGWNTKADGTGTNYNTGSTYTGNSGLTLYAIWSIDTYQVTYNANGGSGAPGSQTKTYGVNLTLSGTKPTRTGYTFNGWNTKADGTGTNYASGGTYSGNTALTLYAKWTINSYTVTFIASENGGTPDTTKKVNYGSTIGTLPTPTKKYYKFTGWYTAASGGTKIEGTQKITGPVTYYAQFVIDASIYVRTNEIEKAGFPYVRSSNTNKKGYCYVYHNGKWQQGIGK